MFTAPNKSCAFIITEPSGVITAPDWDKDGYYEPNVNCSWTVKVGVNYIIRFQVEFVAIEYNYDCVAADYLEVINRVP